MRIRTKTFYALAVALLGFFVGCAAPLPWPESPLYEFPQSNPGADYPQTVDAAMAAIAGSYAHFDVVAYEDSGTMTPMRAMIVSYGITEFHIKDGQLVQVDRFCHADQLINQESVEVIFSDEATRAIQPRDQEVELTLVDGLWHLFRPASPTLLGIDGDPSLPLSTDVNDTNLTDPDGDGNPGVTVQIRMAGFIDGEIYITRREVYHNYLVLHSDGGLYGHVVDESEQSVIGASHQILRQPSNQVQLADSGMNPIVLIPINQAEISCDTLMARATEVFPEPPSFR